MRRKTTSLQDTRNTLVKRNQKVANVLSVVEGSDRVIEKESDKKTINAINENIKRK